MKKLTLTQGFVALLDDEDFERASGYKWRYDRYAVRTVRNPHKTTIYLHRWLTGAPAGVHVDHVNGHRLDNRRINLRIVSPQENTTWRNGVKESSSQYKGVSWDKRRNKWKAVIGFNYKRIDLGRFADEKDAALAYNEAARRLHGEFAKLNQL